MIEFYFFGGILVGIMFTLVLQKLYNKYATKEFKQKVEEVVCQHDYKLIDNWRSDALGVPYGYKTYECKKCKHKDEKFWYV